MLGKMRVLRLLGFAVALGLVLIVVPSLNTPATNWSSISVIYTTTRSSSFAAFIAGND